MFEIIAEFVTATERLNQIRPAVAIFGSARTPPEHPYYALAEDIARRLSDAGFSVISGGGPGIMEAVNKGAFDGESPAWASTSSCRTSRAATPTRTSRTPSSTSSRAR